MPHIPKLQISKLRDWECRDKCSSRSTSTHRSSESSENLWEKENYYLKLTRLSEENLDDALIEILEKRCRDQEFEYGLLKEKNYFSKILLGELYLEYKNRTEKLEQMEEILSSKDYNQVFGDEKKVLIEKFKLYEKTDQLKLKIAKRKKKCRGKLKRRRKFLRKLREEDFQQQEKERILKNNQQIQEVRRRIRAENYFSLVNGVHIDEDHLRKLMQRIENFVNLEDSESGLILQPMNEFSPEYFYERFINQRKIKIQLRNFIKTTKTTLATKKQELFIQEYSANLSKPEILEQHLQIVQEELNEKVEILQQKQQKYEIFFLNLLQTKEVLNSINHRWLALIKDDEKNQRKCYHHPYIIELCDFIYELADKI